MAWRIDEVVIRGEIDNRVRGRVTGRIWFVGRVEPVELDLMGNAWRDLAGRRLEFVNPEPVSGNVASLASTQTGVIGDCTASRKVKVPDIPMSQIGEYYAAKKKWTWHWGNSLYLEWFSATNGRVVIESASYQLTIAPDFAWEMTAEEEEQQRQANGEAMAKFMERLTGAVAPAEPDPEKLSGAAESTDESELTPVVPETEAEAEKRDAENELLIDRITARMAREGPGANFEKIMNEERERRRIERGEPPASLSEERNEERAEAMNEAMAEAGRSLDEDAGIDFDDMELEDHPVSQQAYRLTLRLMQEPDRRGWIPEGAGEEHPLIDLAAATSKAGAKISGALNGEDWPPALDSCAGVIVRLKRARGYLDDALAAAEFCRQHNLAEAAWISDVQRELSSLAADCDRLLAELRARLAQGS